MDHTSPDSPLTHPRNLHEDIKLPSIVLERKKYRHRRTVSRNVGTRDNVSRYWDHLQLLERGDQAMWAYGGMRMDCFRNWNCGRRDLLGDQCGLDRPGFVSMRKRVD